LAGLHPILGKPYQECTDGEIAWTELKQCKERELEERREKALALGLHRPDGAQWLPVTESAHGWIKDYGDDFEGFHEACCLTCKYYADAWGKKGDPFEVCQRNAPNYKKDPPWPEIPPLCECSDFVFDSRKHNCGDPECPICAAPKRTVTAIPTPRSAPPAAPMVKRETGRKRLDAWACALKDLPPGFKVDKAGGVIRHHSAQPLARAT
jgi:hypothetical protein